jgi:hypothetical protein
MTDDDRKISKKFRKWWKKHEGHLIVKQPYGGATYCAKCLEVAPYPYKGGSW